jgi:hypothetical protein
MRWRAQLPADGGRDPPIRLNVKRSGRRRERHRDRGDRYGTGAGASVSDGGLRLVRDGTGVRASRRVIRMAAPYAAANASTSPRCTPWELETLSRMGPIRVVAATASPSSVAVTHTAITAAHRCPPISSR